MSITRITSLLSILIIFSIISCEKLAELTRFNLDYDSSVVIPSSSGVDLPFNIFTPDVETNSESEFAVNDTRKDLIEEIILTQLDLTLTSPSDGDFSFLKSIEVFISADGVDEEKIAWNENVSADVGSYLILETADIDLQEFIKADNFSLRVNTVTDEFIATDHHIDIHSVFFVDARILGL